jgi:hypothetical protein
MKTIVYLMTVVATISAIAYSLACQQQPSIFSEQSKADETTSALPPTAPEQSNLLDASAVVAIDSAVNPTQIAAPEKLPDAPAPKPIITTADAEKVTSRAKDALAELAIGVESAGGDCKKMAATIMAFSQSKQPLFNEMKTIETKLTATQRKEIEAKYQSDIKAIGARLTKPLGACTSDPDLMKAMSVISQNGAMASSNSPLAAKPTVSDAAAVARLDRVLGAWASSGTTLATDVAAANKDCSKMLIALESFTPGVPAMMTEMQEVLPKATSADLEILAKKYEPQMSAMEKVLALHLKICEKDPKVVEEIKKLPRMKKR